ERAGKSVGTVASIPPCSPPSGDEKSRSYSQIVQRKRGTGFSLLRLPRPGQGSSPVDSEDLARDEGRPGAQEHDSFRDVLRRAVAPQRGLLGPARRLPLRGSLRDEHGPRGYAVDRH